MAAQSTTLSSAGVSAPIILNPVFKTTTIQVTGTANSSVTALVVEFTLDDPTTTPPPTISWATLSSAIATSSNAGISGGVIYTVLSPLGGLRLNATSSASGLITLKALQSVTG